MLTLHTIVRKEGEIEAPPPPAPLLYCSERQSIRWRDNRSAGATIAARRTGRIRGEIDGDGERPGDGWDLEATPRPVPRRHGRRPGRRPAPGPVRGRPRRGGLRGPGRAAWPDGPGHLPRRAETRARRRGRLPGHLPRVGEEGAHGARRRGAGRLAAPGGLSRRDPGRRRIP